VTVPLNRFAWLERVLCDRNVSLRAARLAGIIAVRYANKAGIAWPAQSTLAADLGLDPRKDCGVRAVRTNLRALERLGYMSRFRLNDGKTSTCCTLTLPPGADEVLTGGARRSAVRAQPAARPRDDEPRQPMLRTLTVIEGGVVAPGHFEDIWRRARSRLAELLGARDFARWIAPLVVLSADDQRVVIASGSRFDRDRVVEQYGPRITDALQEHIPSLSSVDFVITPSASVAAQ